MIFPIVICCVRCWFRSVRLAKVRKKKCSTMFHGIFLRHIVPSPDSVLHSRPTHRARCQMQSAIRPHFFARTGHFRPLVCRGFDRTPPRCRLSLSTHRHCKKTSVVSSETRQLLATSSPLFAPRSPLRSPSLPLTHVHTRTPSLFDFAFTLQANRM